MALKISLIVRPPGDESVVEEIRGLVDAAGCGPSRVAAHDVRGARCARFARAAARRRYDLVLAAGGDGTIDEVVNGLALSEWQPRLGVIPIGTANDFARGLQLPESARMRFGRSGLRASGGDGRCGGKPPLLMNVSTGGFGAEATESAPREAKRKLGKLAYIVTGAKKAGGLEAKPGAFCR